MHKNFNAILRKIFGRRLGFKAEAFAKLAGLGWNYIDDRIKDPARVDAEVAADADNIAAEDRELRVLVTSQFADQGQRLAELKAKHGGGPGWINVLRSRRISPRTAYNKIALWNLRCRAPEAFDKLAHLGPAKLYMLATLSDEALASIHPDRAVETTSGTKALRHLTDDQLRAHLRELFPIKERPRHKRLCQTLAKCTRIVRQGVSFDHADIADLTIAHADARLLLDTLTLTLHRRL